MKFICTVQKFHLPANRKTGYVLNFYFTIVSYTAFQLYLNLCLGGTTVIMLGTRIAWNKLSTPWSQQREIKMAKASARLMDLVACKDVVLSHTMEKKERLKLQQAVYSDKEELRHLFWAEAISKFIEYATFTFIMPSLFIYVKEIDLTMERVFQLLLIVVIQDEMVRAYLAFAETTQIMEEGNRAKQTFATVLHVDEDILFPSDFAVVKSFFCRIFPRNSEEKENKELESSASFININCPGKFSLQNASMGYWRHDGSFNDVLKDINLDLAVGSHYAIMGETGAGKSTLFKVSLANFEVLELASVQQRKLSYASFLY